MRIPSISEFVPPVLRHWRRQLVAARTPVFESYDEALRACGEAYEDPLLAAVVKEKTIRAARSDVSSVLDRHTVSSTLLAVLMARSGRAPDAPITVLDYGGAFGIAYFLVKQVLGLQCRWAVVETSRFVEEARTLKSEEVGFFKTIGEAVNWLGSIDLVYSSSALPYVPTPKSIICELLQHNPRYMLWARIYLSAGDQLITVQKSDLTVNGPGSLKRRTPNRVVRYPRTFFPEQTFLSLLRQNYRLALKLSEGKPPMRIRGRLIISDAHYFFVNKEEEQGRAVESPDQLN